MEYDLELEKVITHIMDKKPKIVCIQLPEGLKTKALDISKEIEERTFSKVIIWAGSCYGACDVPDLTKLGVDLLIQWGHSPWDQ